MNKPYASHCFLSSKTTVRFVLLCTFILVVQGEHKGKSLEKAPSGTLHEPASNVYLNGTEWNSPTVNTTSGLITWHDNSFPVTSHAIEPADPCKAGGSYHQVIYDYSVLFRMKSVL